MTFFRIDTKCPLGKLQVLMGLPDERIFFDTCALCEEEMEVNYVHYCSLLGKEFRYGESDYTGECNWGVLFLGKEESL